MAVNPICPQCRKFGKNYRRTISLVVDGRTRKVMAVQCQHCNHKYLLPVIEMV